jgi:hypothetical protein
VTVSEPEPQPLVETPTRPRRRRLVIWDDQAGIFGRRCHYEQVPGALTLTAGRGSYEEGSLEISPSDSQFFADGTDPGTIPQ